MKLSAISSPFLPLFFALVNISAGSIEPIPSSDLISFDIRLKKGKNLKIRSKNVLFSFKDMSLIYLLWLCHINNWFFHLKRIKMIYYSTTRSKFLQLIRERVTYASASNDVCLATVLTFEDAYTFMKILRGDGLKRGWNERYNLEASASTRNRHKKIGPVFDLVLYASVKYKKNSVVITRDDFEIPYFPNLDNNDYSFYDITACLTVTMPKAFIKIEPEKTALFDLSNRQHLNEINKRIKKIVKNAEYFDVIQNLTFLDHYIIEKRNPKVSLEQAEKKYQKALRAWEKEFSKNPEIADKKPKRSSVSKHEWTVCLSPIARAKVSTALKGLIIAYDKRNTYPNKELGFLKEVDRVHGFISKYCGHRGVRSDIGREYALFKKAFAKHTQGKKLESVLGNHVLKLGYVSQLKEEYKNWGGSTFYDQDSIELMMLRAGDNFVFRGDR